MNDAFKSFRCQSGFSSPRCHADEIAPDHCEPLSDDPEQPHDAAPRRRAGRTRPRVDAGKCPLPDEES